MRDAHHAVVPQDGDRPHLVVPDRGAVRVRRRGRLGRDDVCEGVGLQLLDVVAVPASDDRSRRERVERRELHVEREEGRRCHERPHFQVFFFLKIRLLKKKMKCKDSNLCLRKENKLDVALRNR